MGERKRPSRWALPVAASPASTVPNRVPGLVSVGSPSRLVHRASRSAVGRPYPNASPSDSLRGAKPTGDWAVRSRSGGHGFLAAAELQFRSEQAQAAFSAQHAAVTPRGQPGQPEGLGQPHVSRGLLPGRPIESRRQEGLREEKLHKSDAWHFWHKRVTPKTKG